VPLVMMGLVGMLAYEFQVSLPVLAKDTFHGGSEAYGFMTAAIGLGAVSGGLFTAARGRTGIRPMIVSAVGFGLAILFTALTPMLWLSYLGLLFVGWASVSFVSIGNSTIQLSAAPNMRGRALSLWQLAFQGTTPLGGPLIGWVIEESEARVGMAVGALSCFVAAAGGMLLSRRRTVSAPSESSSAGTDVAGPERPLGQQPR
jgi:MFS family permease